MMRNLIETRYILISSFCAVSHQQTMFMLMQAMSMLCRLASFLGASPDSAPFSSIYLKEERSFVKMKVPAAR